MLVLGGDRPVWLVLSCVGVPRRHGEVENRRARTGAAPRRELAGRSGRPAADNAAYGQRTKGIGAGPGSDLRPAVAQDRLRLLADGRIVLTLKTAWADGTRQLVFEPLTLLEKLAALTPRPRINLVLYHGVLAPHAGWRARELAPRPEPREARRQVQDDAAHRALHPHGELDQPLAQRGDLRASAPRRPPRLARARSVVF